MWDLKYMLREFFTPETIVKAAKTIHQKKSDKSIVEELSAIIIRTVLFGRLPITRKFSSD